MPPRAAHHPASSHDPHTPSPANPAAAPFNRAPRLHLHLPSSPITADALRRRFDALPYAHLAFRQQLGLPTDRPLILTGHQPGFFHPGILAKYLAARALAHRTAAAAAMLVVDHDAAEPLALSLPSSLDPDRLPTPIPLHLGSPLPLGAAAESLPAIPDPTPTPTLPAHLPEPVRRATDRALAALRDAATDPRSTNAALQAALANAHLLDIHPLGPLIPSSRLPHTDLFRSLVARLADEPAALLAFNRAVAAHPSAGVAPLAGVHHDRTDHNPELPLWRLDPHGRRLPLRLDHLASTPPDRLRPRALLMTGLLRLAACELFIHGTGGAAYDRATDHWFQHWLGSPLPAPVLTASADLYLPSEPTEPATPADLAAADYLAHHARHSPAALDLHADEAERRRLVAAIDAAPDEPARYAAFRNLHDFLANYRQRHADRLALLDRHRRRLHHIARWRRSNQGRTWPAFLYPTQLLNQLDQAITNHLA